MKASFFLLISLLVVFFVLIQADAEVQDETVKNTKTEANHLEEDTNEHHSESQYHDTDYANDAHTESQLHDAEF
jgi:hypothetical protein